MKHYTLIFTIACFVTISCKAHKIQVERGNSHISILHKIYSSDVCLGFDSLGERRYGVVIYIRDSISLYEKMRPLEINIVNTNGTAIWLDTSYSNISQTGNTVRCSGTLITPNGSKFQFTDTYSAYSNKGLFEVDRVVKVMHAGINDTGFSSRLAFHRNIDSRMSDYEFFVPSIWYKNNAYAPSNALASDFSDNYYWFREDRLPLPIFMIREINTGMTFSIYHKDADGSTFAEERGLDRIIDGRMKFASIGMQNKNRPLIGILFPGSEGEETCVAGYKKKDWAYRSNPVSTNYTQRYNIVISLTKENNFVSAMKNTWHKYFKISNPPIYNCDLNQVYDCQINVLNRYWKVINGAPGFPFGILLNGAIKSKTDYNYDMGFVGMQIPNAALLIREGFKKGDSSLLSKGEQIVDWWAKNAIYPPNGAIRTWYDPLPQKWRSNYPTYLRVIGDGLKGLLWAWNFEKKNGINKNNWLVTCKRGANWILSWQSPDGSFPRSIDYKTNTIKDHEKNNTSHVIPFLVDLYEITKNEKYKQAALKAGEFIFKNSYKVFRYIGGTVDHPNVTDKEAASMALRAYLALYDLNKNSMWLNAAEQAAYYYQTWVYCWNVPIPKDDPKSIYPKNRSVTGLSIISAPGNGSDTYAAIDAFNFYRLYLYTGDKQLLSTSKILLKNTKQALNWDKSNLIPGYGLGMVNEAMNITIPRGHGVGFYILWQCNNYLEPMVLLKDVFGYFDIDKIEKTESVDEKRLKNESYSSTRDLFILR